MVACRPGGSRGQGGGLGGSRGGNLWSLAGSGVAGQGGTLRAVEGKGAPLGLARGSQGKGAPLGVVGVTVGL